MIFIDISFPFWIQHWNDVVDALIFLCLKWMTTHDKNWFLIKMLYSSIISPCIILSSYFFLQHFNVFIFYSSLLLIIAVLHISAHFTSCNCHHSICVHWTCVLFLYWLPLQIILPLYLYYFSLQSHNIYSLKGSCIL